MNYSIPKTEERRWLAIELRVQLTDDEHKREEAVKVLNKLLDSGDHGAPFGERVLLDEYKVFHGHQSELTPDMELVIRHSFRVSRIQHPLCQSETEKLHRIAFEGFLHWLSPYIQAREGQQLGTAFLVDLLHTWVTVDTRPRNFVYRQGKIQLQE